MNRQVAGVILLILIGVAGLVYPVTDAVQEGLSTPLEILGVLAPFLLALPIWYTAYWRYKLGTNGNDTLVIAVWCLGFTFVAALIAAVSILAQAGSGVSIYEPLLLVNNVGVTGSLLGVIVGYFHTNSRQRTRKYADARDKLAEQKQHLVFLNRLLRHDIRNDINVIHGYAELLSEEYPEEAHLETIVRKSEEIDELTVLAHDLSEAATDTPTEDIQLASVIDEALIHVRDSFPDATVTVEGDIPRTLTVQANEMLSAVFQNLLRNAIQHNDKPTPKATVQVEVKPSTVLVRITDNGPGIPETVKHTLFQAGQKGAESSGTGLGLYLVETLVTSFDGDVWISDAEDGGTTVTVELPR